MLIYSMVCDFFFQDLYKKYSHIRKTRPDGNCFYRAFGFAHLESLLDDSKELQKWVSQQLLSVLLSLLISKVHVFKFIFTKFYLILQYYQMAMQLHESGLEYNCFLI